MVTVAARSTLQQIRGNCSPLGISRIRLAPIALLIVTSGVAFKHKERIVQATALNEDELLECPTNCWRGSILWKEGSIPIGTWLEARGLCRDADLKDSTFIALALHLGYRLWTGDEELKAGLRAKGFTAFSEP